MPLFCIAVIISSILIQIHQKDNEGNAFDDEKILEFDRNESIIVPVYLSHKKIVKQIPIENYVKGVIFAEMPMNFKLEALKAQAIAARTYIVQKMKESQKKGSNQHEYLVIDTTLNQAYIDEHRMEEQLNGEQMKKFKKKLDQAVTETKDQIILFKQEPIQATYFSTSNGYTENAEDYWANSLPYLRSVKSPWDEKCSPKYRQEFTFSCDELLNKLELKQIHKRNIQNIPIEVTERTKSNRIKKIKIGNTVFEGRVIREKLGIASTDFEWKWLNSELVITTYGYGHGVGMSQYGANGMASLGKTAKEIIYYYYPGVTLGKVSEVIKINKID